MIRTFFFSPLCYLIDSLSTVKLESVRCCCEWHVLHSHPLKGVRVKGEMTEDFSRAPGPMHGQSPSSWLRGCAPMEGSPLASASTPIALAQAQASSPPSPPRDCLQPQPGSRCRQWMLERKWITDQCSLNTSGFTAS